MVGRPTPERLKSVRGHLVTLLLLFVAVAATSGAAAITESRLSPIDEATHIDYAYSVSVGGIPRKGERLSQPVLDEWACRGFHDSSVEFPRCRDGGEYNAKAFPASGYNYNQFHPPVYYAVTGITARAVVAVTPIDSFVTAARLTGTLWITAGLFVAYLLMVTIGVSRFAASVVALGGAFLPAVWQTGAQVSNDNATLVAGASVMLVALWISQDRAGPLVAALVASVALGTKTVTGLAIIAAGLFLCLEVYGRYRDGREYRRQLASAAAMVVMIPLIQYGWKAVQSARAFDPDYKNPVAGISGVKAEGVPYSEFYSEILTLLRPSYGVYGFYGLDAGFLNTWLRVFGMVIAVAPIAVAVAVACSPVRKRFGLSTVVAAMLGALLVTVQYWMGAGYYLAQANPRYGLTLLMLNLVCIAILVDFSVAGRRAALVMTALGFLVTVPQLVF